MTAALLVLATLAVAALLVGNSALLRALVGARRQGAEARAHARAADVRALRAEGERDRARDDLAAARDAIVRLRTAKHQQVED